MDIEFEEVLVTEENIKWVAEKTGRPLEALQQYLNRSRARHEAMHVLVRKN